MPSVRTPQLIVVCLATVLAAAASGQTAAPDIPSLTSSDESVAADAPPAWIGQPIVLPGDADTIVLAEDGGPYALVGLDAQHAGRGRIIDLRSGEEVGEVADLPPGELLLSRSGTLLLSMPRKAGANPQEIAAYDATGAEVSRYAFGERDRVEPLAIAETVGIFAVQSGGDRRVFGIDLVEGTKAFATPVAEFIAMKPELTSVSPDGSLVAIGDYNEELVLIDVETGEIADRRDIDGPGATNVALAFSPDGETLAIMQNAYGRGTGAVDRLAITLMDTRRGRTVGRCSLRGRSSDLGPYPYAYKGEPLEWFPDGRHLLIYGIAVLPTDATEPLVVLDGLRSPPSRTGLRLVNSAPRRAAPGAILSGTRTASREAALVGLPLAFDRYAELLAAVGDYEPPSAERADVLRPGDEVGLVVDVADTQFDQDEQTREQLDGLFLTLLEGLGLTVVETDEQPAADDPLPVLRVTYREGKGDKAYEIRGILDRTRTGRTLNTTDAAALVEWTDAAGKRTYWQESVELSTGFTRVRDWSDKGARDAAVEKLMKRLQAVPLPYYLHRDAKPSDQDGDASKPRRRTRRSRRRSEPTTPEAQPVLTLPARPRLPSAG